jgi:sodium/proline symporter
LIQGQCVLYILVKSPLIVNLHHNKQKQLAMNFGQDQVQMLVVMIAYISLLILWGVYQGRKVKTSSDFAIAGRKLPGWIAALSERATGESSWALLGLPGAAYATGLTEIWTAIGCVAGIIVAWVLLAWRLRDAAEKYNVSTFTEFIAKRHSESEKWIRIIGSGTIIFFFFLYVGAQFLGGGKTLSTMFSDLSLWTGVLITAAIIIPYTIYGGFMSVVYTDVVQAIVMIIALIITPIVGVIYLANHPELFATNIPDALTNAGSNYTNFVGAASGFGAGMVIAGGFSWFFGYLGGQPQLSMRFMAISDKKQAKKARNIGVIWTIIAYIGALCIGWIGIALFGPEGLQDQEQVMPKVVLTLFHPVIAAILITGAIAAMISTADSLLILSATELNENIINPQLKDKKRKALLRSRIVTAVLALVALLVAYIAPSDLIFDMVSYVWAGIGGTFSVVILLTLFWKKYHGKAALITIISGMLFTILWIGTGMEKHFKVTDEKIEAFVSKENIEKEMEKKANQLLNSEDEKDIQMISNYSEQFKKKIIFDKLLDTLVIQELDKRYKLAFTVFNNELKFDKNEPVATVFTNYLSKDSIRKHFLNGNFYEFVKDSNLYYADILGNPNLRPELVPKIDSFVNHEYQRRILISKMMFSHSLSHVKLNDTTISKESIMNFFDPIMIKNNMTQYAMYVFKEQNEADKNLIQHIRNECELMPEYNLLNPDDTTGIFKEKIIQKLAKNEIMLRRQIILWLTPIKEERIVMDFTLKNTLSQIMPKEFAEKHFSMIKSSFTHKGYTSRILTFFVALVIAILTTFLIKPGRKPEEADKVE